jgi:menaquinone-dependent protoporphyrinogen oxidase
MNVLVAYASKRGSTQEVAEAVAATLREHGLSVDLQPASAVRTLAPYEGVVLGGALYTGRWHSDARAFLQQHRHVLTTKPVAVFAMGPRTLDDHEVAASRIQLDKALAKTPRVTPTSVAIFGGVVDPAQLRFPFNRIPASDARDWDAIESWAAEVAASFAGLADRV